EEIAFEAPDDALAQAAEIENRAADGRLDRRLDRANQKRTGNPHALDRLPDQSRAQRVEVELEVREFWHLTIDEPESLKAGKLESLNGKRAPSFQALRLSGFRAFRLLGSFSNNDRPIRPSRLHVAEIQLAQSRLDLRAIADGGRKGVV